MTDKNNDRDITGQMVNEMNAQELQDFENRLCSKAAAYKLTTQKKKHPVYGNVFMLIDKDNNVEVSGVDICELKEYLYTFK